MNLRPSEISERKNWWANKNKSNPSLYDYSIPSACFYAEQRWALFLLWLMKNNIDPKTVVSELTAESFNFWEKEKFTVLKKQTQLGPQIYFFGDESHLILEGNLAGTIVDIVPEHNGVNGPQTIRPLLESPKDKIIKRIYDDIKYFRIDHNHMVPLILENKELILRHGGYIPAIIFLFVKRPFYCTRFLNSWRGILQVAF